MSTKAMQKRFSEEFRVEGYAKRLNAATRSLTLLPVWV